MWANGVGGPTGASAGAAGPPGRAVSLLATVGPGGGTGVPDRPAPGSVEITTGGTWTFEEQGVPYGTDLVVSGTCGAGGGGANITGTATTGVGGGGGAGGGSVKLLIPGGMIVSAGLIDVDGDRGAGGTSPGEDGHQGRTWQMSWSDGGATKHVTSPITGGGSSAQHGGGGGAYTAASFSAGVTLTAHTDGSPGGSGNGDGSGGHGGAGVGGGTGGNGGGLGDWSGHNGTGTGGGGGSFGPAQAGQVGGDGGQTVRVKISWG